MRGKERFSGFGSPVDSTGVRKPDLVAALIGMTTQLLGRPLGAWTPDGFARESVVALHPEQLKGTVSETALSSQQDSQPSNPAPRPARPSLKTSLRALRQI